MKDFAALRARAAEAGVVIIGAGQAGGRAAETLRAEGFAGPITLIGDEAERPYERPSLSKEMLLDTSRETITWLHDADFYARHRIATMLGTLVTAIDRDARKVTLADGSSLPYGVLIIATGSRARRLEVPSGDAGCFYVRSLEDSRALRHRFAEGHRVVVIGAGFIGLEVAAAAIKRGCSVTVVERGDAPLGRVVPETVRQAYRALHESYGVSFRLVAEVVDVVASGDGQSVLLTNGEALPADTVVVGIGAIPNDGIAATSGLACAHGILVDAFGQTADPAIFAAGDVARHHNPLLDREVLLESWQNAQNQAIAIARNLARAGEPVAYAEMPWFWSDQYDVSLQVYGMIEDEVTTVLRGDTTARSWLLFQVKGGKIVFVAGINAARDLRPIRDLMKLGAAVDPAQLADTTIPTIEFLRRAQAALTD